jgi:amino acid transporter
MPSSTPRRTLSLLDSICIIVGTIIGAGVFGTAAKVAGMTPNVTVMIGMWIAAGLIVLVGAACFIELTTRFPDEAGGDYAYLKKAYGHPIAFMFAWSAFWIVRPANIGIMATLFGIHFAQIIAAFPIVNQIPSSTLQILGAITAVTLLTAGNLLGIKNGKLTQNILTIAKIAGIGLIILLALTHPNTEAVAPVETKWEIKSLWLALVFVMFSFGGWNDMAMIANEIRSPKKNLWRCLIFGVGIVTLVYVTFNIALAVGLGQAGMAASESPAITLVATALGGEGFFAERAQELVAALICISCLGAVNGMIITSPRIYYAVGRDYPALNFLAQWNDERSCPWQALILQSLVTISLILFCLMFKLQAIEIFDVLLVASAPYFWTFLGATVLSLLVFRAKEKSKGTHFRLPLFPFEPIFFAIVCAGLTYNAIDYLMFKQYQMITVAIGGMMIVGVVLGMVLKAESKSGKPD